MDPFFRDVDLVFSDALSGCYYLTVNICKTHFVIVYQVQSTYAAPGQSLHGISSDTSDAEHGNTCILKLIHAFMTKQ